MTKNVNNDSSREYFKIKSLAMYEAIYQILEWMCFNHFVF